MKLVLNPAGEFLMGRSEENIAELRAKADRDLNQMFNEMQTQRSALSDGVAMKRALAELNSESKVPCRLDPTPNALAAVKKLEHEGTARTERTCEQSP